YDPRVRREPQAIARDAPIPWGKDLWIDTPGDDTHAPRRGAVVLDQEPLERAGEGDDLVDPAVDQLLDGSLDPHSRPAVTARPALARPRPMEVGDARHLTA